MKLTRRITALALTVALGTGLLSGCGSSGGTSSTGSSTAGGEEKVLNIFTWATYFPDDVIAEFTQTTGIKVNYSNFSTNEEMLSKLQASKGGDYDIVLASDYIIDSVVKENLAAELPKDKIPNLQNINPDFQGKFYDPESKYTVPYAAGIPLIIYNPDLVDFEIKGYADLWNPALKDSVVVMDDARNIIGITLKTMGESFNTTDPAVLEEAKTKLLELRPNIRAFDYDTPYNLMISGETSVGYMFTSQINTALQGNPNLKIVYPAEGLGFGIDSCFVPVNAPHKDNAALFLDFILEAERSAHITEQILYISCNAAATQYIQNPALVAPEGVASTGEFITDVGDAADIFNSIWTEFKLS